MAFWLSLAVACGQAQQRVDPRALLEVAAEKIEAGVAHQRRFSCDATVLREMHASDGALKRRDRLHVEVAVFDGRQLFSWPQGGGFVFESLDQMTGSGPSGTGEFGPFAASFLADSDPASVRFRGVRSADGVQVAEYSYSVPLNSSHYEIKAGEHRFGPTAYQGSVFVDASTGDLRRQVIQAPNPPADTGVLRAEVDTSYEPRSEEGLFPGQSSVTMELEGGNRVNIQTTYRGCRTFTAESTLHFGGESNAEAAESPDQETTRVPAGLEVRSVMITPVDTRTSYAGDLFEARLVAPIKQGKQTLAPKGAVLRGRIVRVEQEYIWQPSASLGLKFHSVEFNGKSEAITLKARPPVNPYVDFEQRHRIETPKRQPEPPEPGAQVTTIRVFGSDHIRFDQHTVSLWMTQ